MLDSKYDCPSAGIANVILNEMIYGTGVGAQIKNNAIFTMPEWYMNGLIAYLTENCCGGKTVCAPVCSPGPTRRKPGPKKGGSKP